MKRHKSTFSYVLVAALAVCVGELIRRPPDRSPVLHAVANVAERAEEATSGDGAPVDVRSVDDRDPSPGAEEIWKFVAASIARASRPAPDQSEPQ